MKTISHSAKKGFTLLELLIVIAVIAVLSAILIFILDPTETLAKARDTQRISDMGSLKTAIGVYVTGTTTASLDGVSGASRNDKCLGGSGTKSIFPSIDSGTTLTFGIVTGFTAFSQVAEANSSLTDGTGWIPVNLSGIVGGSPISNMPIDPINTVAVAATPANTDLYYRYACRKSPLTFELDAKLESIAFTTTDNRATKDGGNNSTLYEVGTDLAILPSSGAF